MMAWIFGISILIAAGIAALLENTRKSILFLWFAGMLAGCFFLSCQCELLAVIQWIVSTVVCLSLLHFATLFGEHTTTWREEIRDKARFKLQHLLSLGVATGFGSLIWFVSRNFPHEISAPENIDLHSLGRLMADHHLPSMEVLALTFLVVIIGGGVIARQE